MKLLIVTIMLLLSLTSCTKVQQNVEEAVLEGVEEQLGSGVALTDTIPYSGVDLVLLETKHADGNIDRTPIRFSEHGVVKGSEKLMVPVVEGSNTGLSRLDIISEVSVDGKSCSLTYGDNVLDFDVESITCFLNDEPVQFLTDIPMYINGTIYIPLETVLDALNFGYRYEENKLIVFLGDDYSDGI